MSESMVRSRDLSRQEKISQDLIIIQMQQTVLDRAGESNLYNSTFVYPDNCVSCIGQA